MANTDDATSATKLRRKTCDESAQACSPDMFQHLPEASFCPLPSLPKAIRKYLDELRLEVEELEVAQQKQRC